MALQNTLPVDNINLCRKVTGESAGQAEVTMVLHSKIINHKKYHEVSVHLSEPVAKESAKRTRKTFGDTHNVRVEKEKDGDRYVWMVYAHERK